MDKLVVVVLSVLEVDKVLVVEDKLDEREKYYLNLSNRGRIFRLSDQYYVYFIYRKKKKILHIDICGGTIGMLGRKGSCGPIDG